MQISMPPARPPAGKDRDPDRAETPLPPCRRAPPLPPPGLCPSPGSQAHAPPAVLAGGPGGTRGGARARPEARQSRCPGPTRKRGGVGWGSGSACACPTCQDRLPRVRERGLPRRWRAGRQSAGRGHGGRGSGPGGGLESALLRSVLAAAAAPVMGRGGSAASLRGSALRSPSPALPPGRPEPAGN